MAAVTAAAIAAGGAVTSASLQRRAGRDAIRAAQEAEVDPDDVARRTRAQSLQAIEDSLAAEQRFAPENARLRRSSINRLQRLVDEPESTVVEDIDVQIEGGGTARRSQLLADAIRTASDELALGGRLDAETRDRVSRSAAAGASRIGGGRLELARFITPRDLGLTSLDLAQRRLATAGGLGQVDQALEQQDFDNLLRLREARERFGSNRLNRGYQLAAFGQNLTPPQVGLSGGDFASLFTNNASNRARTGVAAAELRSQNARNTAQTAGAIGGLATAVGDRFFTNGDN